MTNDAHVRKESDRLVCDGPDGCGYVQTNPGYMEQHFSIHHDRNIFIKYEPEIDPAFHVRTEESEPGAEVVGPEDEL